MNCMQIKKLVEEKFNVDNLGKDTRSRKYTEMRSIYYNLCQRYASDFTLSHCGQVVGRINHATVIHGLKTFDWLIETAAWMDQRKKFNSLVREIRYNKVILNSKRTNYSRSLSNLAHL